MAIQETIKGSPIWINEQSKDPEIELLKQNTLKLCEEACERMKFTYSNFPQYTLHDETHLSNMIALLPMILQENISSLNELEKLLLLLGVCFHDIGMAPKEDELKEILESSEYKLFFENWKVNHPNFVDLLDKKESAIYSETEKNKINEIIASLEKACLTDYLRQNHPDNANKFIEASYSDDKRMMFHEINLSSFIGKLAIAHGKDISYINDRNDFRCDEQIHTYIVNLSFLAILIRLADILDFDKSRTPDILYKSIKLEDDISIKEWEKHRSVRGWSISKKEISFTAECVHPVYENVVRNFINQIEKELQDCITITKNYSQGFEKYKLDLPIKIDRSRIGPKNRAYITHNIEFSLSRNEIVNLLMTDKLYSRPSLCIRELLQNSADAIRTRKALYASKDLFFPNGKIEFRHYLNDENEEILECHDNGVGMDLDIINNYFTKVGRSYYKSPEFEQNRKLWKEKKVDFDPCSQFGIGFMSCFMLGDQIKIKTRRDNGPGEKSGDPLIIEINGTEGIFFIKYGLLTQEIGTTVRIKVRNKKNYFDVYNDNVRLISTLRGYALAGEFPIFGKCEIEGITEETLIEPGVSRNPSFLELADIKKIKCFSCDLKNISPYLSGTMNESFLIDQNGMLSIKNEDAEWIMDKRLNHNDLELKTKTFLCSNGERLHSICFDGILITGRGGRVGDKRKVFDFMGWRNPGTYNNASFCLDVRGPLKAEITPARIPNESNMHPTPRWRQIYDCLNKAESKIWSQIISEKIATPEIFWQLINIYEPNLFFLNSLDVLNLSLPLIKNSDTSFKVVNLIKYFTCEDKNLKFDDDSFLQFPDYCESWSRTNWDVSCLVTRLLILCSTVTLKDDHLYFIIQKNIDNFCLGDKIIQNEYNFILGTTFDKHSNQYLSVYSEYPIVNSQHPLFLLAIEAKYKTEKSIIEKFAWSVCLNIPKSLKTENNSLNISNISYLKFLGNLYYSIEWGKYDNKLKAPYIVRLSNGNDFSITEELLKSWIDLKDDSYDFFNETEKAFILKKTIGSSNNIKEKKSTD